MPMRSCHWGVEGLWRGQLGWSVSPHPLRLGSEMKIATCMWPRIRDCRWWNRERNGGWDPLRSNLRGHWRPIGGRIKGLESPNTSTQPVCIILDMPNWLVIVHGIQEGLSSISKVIIKPNKMGLVVWQVVFLNLHPSLRIQCQGIKAGFHHRSTWINIDIY